MSLISVPLGGFVSPNARAIWTLECAAVEARVGRRALG
jgi:hypothetical protein